MFEFFIIEIGQILNTYLLDSRNTLCILTISLLMEDWPLQFIDFGIFPKKFDNYFEKILKTLAYMPNS